jgi:hypothetical protein
MSSLDRRRSEKPSNIVQAMHEAEQRIAKTLRPGDTVKWTTYRAMSKPDQLAWRLQEWHAKFVRLQRLAFYQKI